jgi:hypothetical protein
MEQLTKQEQDFVKEVAITGNATQAVKKAFKKSIKKDSSARSKGSQLLTNTNIIQAVAETKKTIAEQLPDELLVKKHLDLLEQKQLAYFVFSKKLTDEEIEGHMQANGLDLIVIRETEKGKMAFYSIPDAQAIKNGLEMAYKVKGSYEEDKQKSINILIPVLVRFLDKKDDEGNSNTDTK